MPSTCQNRYGSNANSKPQVRKAASSNGSNEVAQRTYAIILSGGVNKTPTMSVIGMIVLLYTKPWSTSIAYQKETYILLCQMEIIQRQT